MANEEHVKILRQGSEAWNKWREENPDIEPDLVGANLIGANLIGANLMRANLIGAILAGADLAGANLAMANLAMADLTGASFKRANLVKACLVGANLEKADLTGVSLKGALLVGAKLDGTILDGKDIKEITGARRLWAKQKYRFVIRVDNNITIKDLAALLNAISRLHELVGVETPRIEKIAIGHEQDQPVTYGEEWR